MSASSDAIKRLKSAVPPPTDAEVLAQMFDTATLSDDGSLIGRLRVILDATAHAAVPGLQTGIELHDTGFRSAFKDPWKHSDNQVGHFLTAVGLSFNPGQVSKDFLGRKLRDWLGADSSLSDEEVAVRLVVGHEKAPDPGPGTAAGGAAVGGVIGGVGGALLTRNPWATAGAAAGGAGIGAGLAILSAFRDQFAACTATDVTAFRGGVSALGSGGKLDGAASAKRLRAIAVDSTVRGNSYADLDLSAYGWWLGQAIKTRTMTGKPDAATWVRDNLM